MQKIIGVQERPPLGKAIPLSIQHMFAMFGASVLVPTVFGIDPAVVFLMNGIGTLFFIFITKAKAPAYLGSSFAFIAPTMLILQNFEEQGFSHMEAFRYAQGGYVVVGLLGCALAAVVWKFGTKWIDYLLPPAAMGPVVALIGWNLPAMPQATAAFCRRSRTHWTRRPGSTQRIPRRLTRKMSLFFS